MEPSTSGGGDAEDDAYAQSFLQNPYYFMFASLAKPDDDTELHWLKVRPHICAFLDAYTYFILGWTDALYHWLCCIIPVPP